MYLVLDTFKRYWYYSGRGMRCLVLSTWYNERPRSYMGSKVSQIGEKVDSIVWACKGTTECSTTPQRFDEEGWSKIETKKPAGWLWSPSNSILENVNKKKLVSNLKQRVTRTILSNLNQYPRLLRP